MNHLRNHIKRELQASVTYLSMVSYAAIVKALHLLDCGQIGSLGQPLLSTETCSGWFLLRQCVRRAWARHQTARLLAYARTQRARHSPIVFGEFLNTLNYHYLIERVGLSRNRSTANTNGKARSPLFARLWKWRRKLPNQSRESLTTVAMLTIIT